MIHSIPCESASSETEKYWTAKVMGGSQIPLLQLPVVAPNRRAQPRCCSSLAGATCAVFPQGWAWDAIRELVRSFCKFHREMADFKRRAEFEEFLRHERRNERESMSSVLPPLSPPSRTCLGLGREENEGKLCLTSRLSRLNAPLCCCISLKQCKFASLPQKKPKKPNPKQETLNGAKVRQTREKKNKRKLFSGQQGADLNSKFTHRFERRLEKQLEK